MWGATMQADPSTRHDAHRATAVRRRDAATHTSGAEVRRTPGEPAQSGPGVRRHRQSRFCTSASAAATASPGPPAPMQHQPGVGGCGSTDNSCRQNPLHRSDRHATETVNSDAGRDRQHPLPICSSHIDCDCGGGLTNDYSPKGCRRPLAVARNAAAYPRVTRPAPPMD